VIFLSKDEEDVIEDLASIARIVVHVEQAYDLADELARAPNKYEDSLAKLSRLAVKVINDIESKINELKKGSQQSDKKELLELESAKKSLSNFGNSLEKLFRYLKSLSEDMRIKEIKRLAALIVAPDIRSLSIRDILWK
jgi:CRISPR-associated protein Csa5